MNRHQRRAARKSAENKFYNDYVARLPLVPLDAELERGKVYIAVHHHDEDCALYTGDELQPIAEG